jgi:hypothetical protein
MFAEDTGTLSKDIGDQYLRAFVKYQISLLLTKYMYSAPPEEVLKVVFSNNLRCYSS